MSLPAQKFREIVFQILYSRTYASSDAEETGAMLMAELKVTKKAILEAQKRARLIEEQMAVFDEQIAAASTEYTFERISLVEKTILRLSLYEMLQDAAIPPRVAIAEAIRLTRKFGTPESAHFVNAILDLIYNKKNGAPIPNEPATL